MYNYKMKICEINHTPEEGREWKLDKGGGFSK